MPRIVQNSLPRLQRLLPKLKGRRIAVLGDLMLDRYLWGDASKLSPEVPVPVVNFTEQSETLGGAGNVAANLASLGARVHMLGVVGDDEPGHAVRACLRRAGIDGQAVVTDSARVTTVKTRIIARKHQIVRIDREDRSAISVQIERALFRRLINCLEKLDGLILSDYDKGVFVSDSFADRVLGACHKAGVPVFVKPKTSRLYAYRGARLIACNTKEAEFFVTRALHDEMSVQQAGQALLAHFGCSAVVITRGGKGMSFFDESARRGVTIPATSFEVTYARVGQSGVERGISGRQVFDVTGAGDTVLSVLSLSLSAGASLLDAAILSNTAAGVVVGKLGTATVTLSELSAALRDLRRSA